MIDSLCTHCNSGINLYKIDTEKLTTGNVSQNTKQVRLNNFKGLSDVQRFDSKKQKIVYGRMCLHSKIRKKGVSQWS